MVFGPKARRRPETLRIVARLAMEAILPLSGKKSGSVSSHPSARFGPRVRRRRLATYALATRYADHQSPNGCSDEFTETERAVAEAGYGGKH
jgi:hypothetical protein